MAARSARSLPFADRGKLTAEHSSAVTSLSGARAD